MYTYYAYIRVHWAYAYTYPIVTCVQVCACSVHIPFIIVIHTTRSYTPGTHNHMHNTEYIMCTYEGPHSKLAHAV